MNRIVINDLVDLVWENNEPVIHVAGKPFRQCSFLAVSIPASEAGKIESIDDLAADKRARSLEGEDAMKALGMSVDDVMQAHASNLIAWVENGYDTRILHSNLSFPLLKALADEGDATAKRVLAGEIHDRVSTLHPGAIAVVLDCCTRYIDGETWEMLAGNPDKWIRTHVAVHPNTPVRVLEHLAVDVDDIVRQRVASNRNTPARMLEQLAIDPDAGVRFRIAANPNTSVCMLEQLAKDVDAIVRWQVANNPNIPARVLARLAGDVDHGVRFRVARNPNTPVHVLEQLAKDVNHNVRWYVADNPNTPARVLEWLAGNPDVDVRSRVASNPNTPARVLEQLAGDKSAGVRETATRKLQAR